MKDEFEYQEEPAPELAGIVDLVPSPPENDSTIILLTERGKRALDYAEQFVVFNQDNANKAVTDLSLVKGLKDKLEEKRKEYVSPLNERVKTINSFFKSVSEPILKADKILRDKILAFNAGVEKERKEAEAREAAKYQLAKEQAATNFGEITVDLSPEVIPEVVKTVRTSVGSATASGTWKYNIVDFSKVPDTYKVINTSVVNAFVRSNKGKVKIPGIEQYFEPTLVVRGK
jgi:hypothetical protein